MSIVTVMWKGTTMATLGEVCRRGDGLGTGIRGLDVILA
jgi:hypothetical protein